MKIYKYLIISILIFSSCDSPKNETIDASTDIAPLTTEKVTEAKNLLVKHCYICHSPSSSSHDEIIAPPMAAVKMRYGMRYSTQEEFVNAIVNWTLDPQSEKALMKGAIDRFNTMPKQVFNKEELNKIAVYIFQADLEEPVWFAAHQEEMHGKGGGKRQSIP